MIIGAIFCTVMALMFTWEACYLAIGAEHAWKVVSTISAFLFAFGAVMLFIGWFTENDGDLR